MELTNDIVDNYFLLIKNLDNKSKLKLISKISDSIFENGFNEDNIVNCFVKLDSKESADEIIENIYKSRNYKIHL